MTRVVNMLVESMTERQFVGQVLKPYLMNNEVRLSVGNTLCLPKAATMSKKAKAHHIVPHPDGGWSVKKAGSPNLIGRFDSRREAVAAGRRISWGQN